MTAPTYLTPSGSRAPIASQTGGPIPPGLALTLVPLDLGYNNGESWRHTDTRWSITHAASGRRIGPGFEERADAQRCAESLAAVTDWTAPASVLTADEGVRERTDAVLERCAETTDAED